MSCLHHAACVAVCPVCLVSALGDPAGRVALGVCGLVYDLAGVGVYDVVGSGRLDGAHGGVLCGVCGSDGVDSASASVVTRFRAGCKC